MTLAQPVSFQTLIDRLKDVPFDELRKQYEGYFEFVMQTRHLPQLYPILESYFGPPFNPAGIDPSAPANDIAGRYGGIQKQQTLYYLKRDGLSSCAMIWPWSSGSRVTVKLAQGIAGEKA